MKRRSISRLDAGGGVGAVPARAGDAVGGQAQHRPRRRRPARRHRLTVTKGTIQNGTVRASATARSPRSGAERQRARPAPRSSTSPASYISPGIIDAHSHIANDSINEGGTTVSSMTGMEDVLDPTDISIYRDLAGGLTTANILHGSANPIGGKNAVIKLRWGRRRARGAAVRGRDARHQVRPRREPEGPAHRARSPARAATR